MWNNQRVERGCIKEKEKKGRRKGEEREKKGRRKVMKEQKLYKQEVINYLRDMYYILTEEEEKGVCVHKGTTLMSDLSLADISSKLNSVNLDILYYEKLGYKIAYAILDMDEVSQETIHRYITKAFRECEKVFENFKDENSIFDSVTHSKKMKEALNTWNDSKYNNINS